MAIGCLGESTVGLKSGISEFTEVGMLQDKYSANSKGLEKTLNLLF